MRYILAAFIFIIFSTTSNAQSAIEKIFALGEDPKIGEINNLATLSYKEKGELHLFVFDEGFDPNDEGDTFWFLRCSQYINDKNLEQVTCGATRNGFLILLTSDGFAIQMESKPRLTGKYNIAFDKNSSFEVNYRIITPNEVRNFLAKMFNAKEMQYSVKDKNGKYVRQKISVENSQLVLSLLKDMREYY
ncbi:hypothetical protein [Acinetobacter indicus]|uniref:hypothetical protein n=1 Tax=Acinetobacter indicus TaxID=756892 RepID=UPI000CEBDEA7|nr:hypothetical protein [Acinetobacter indicus]